MCFWVFVNVREVRSCWACDLPDSDCNVKCRLLEINSVTGHKCQFTCLAAFLFPEANETSGRLCGERQLQMMVMVMVIDCAIHRQFLTNWKRCSISSPKARSGYAQHLRYNCGNSCAELDGWFAQGVGVEARREIHALCEDSLQFY